MKRSSWNIFVILICIFPSLAFAGRDIFHETKMLAEWGKTTSQYKLGLMYYKGQGVEQNYKEAFKWFRVSAQRGLSDAQFYLGLMYYDGKAVTQNYSDAFYLFLAAAKQGQIEAQFILGDMYISGHGVPRSYVNAYAWTSIAYKNGYDQAKQNLQFLNKEMTASELEKAVAEATRVRKSFDK
jgi:TPR repeat protein